MTGVFIFFGIIVILFTIILVFESDFYYDYKEYCKWRDSAIKDFDITKQVFRAYMKAAKQRWGNDAKPSDAYYMAEEEWYDEHYK